MGHSSAQVNSRYRRIFFFLLAIQTCCLRIYLTQQLDKHQSFNFWTEHFDNISSVAPACTATCRLCLFFSDNFCKNVLARGRKTEYFTTLAWSDITQVFEPITELDVITNFDLIISGGFHRTLQRARLANRGRLLLQTPGPVPFGTCIWSNVETILSWTCHVYGPIEFRTSLGTSILPFYVLRSI